MDYFSKVLNIFLGLECGNCVAVYRGQKALGFNQKYINLCSEVVILLTILFWYKLGIIIYIPIFFIYNNNT